MSARSGRGMGGRGLVGVALLLGAGVIACLCGGQARAQAPGLPFTEDFSTDTLRDGAKTTANWSVEEQKVVLAWRKTLYGSFGAATIGSDLTTDAHWTCSIALGDVDGDGDLDLVAGNWSQTNRLYLNNGTADPFNLVTGSDITADAHITFSVALGDVDGDGDLDLVAGNYSGQVNRLYLNNGTADPFAGVTGSDITADAHSTLSAALGDVDGDGDLDLVAGNYQQTNRLYLNNGTADPFAGVTGSDITADVHNTLSAALGDVDGDGDLDLVAGNGNPAQVNRLYLNNGTADPFSGVVGSNVTTDANATASVALGDVDGDGDLDLVAGNINQANRLYLNNGTAAPFDLVTGSNITADAGYTDSVALGDVDGDGDLDLVAGNSTRQVNRLYLNNGTADPFNGVAGSDMTTDANNTLSVALGDVDGDGDLDLVAGNYGQVNRLYLNAGAADPFTGAAGSNITTDAHWTHSVAVGDVDGDGDLDLVAGNRELQVNRLYLNNGTADPFSGVTGSSITADAHNTYAIALGDMDGDGDLDIVAGNYGQPNRLYLNDGTADPFGGITGSDITTDAHNTYVIALGDVDGDGNLDLVAGNVDQANRLYLNNGTADPFGGAVGSDITADSHQTRSIALGDMDGDGDLDLVAGNQNQTNRLYLNNGTADPFNPVTGSNITTDAHSTMSVALGDVDGDGDLDLVAGNSGSQVNRLYLNNGTADPFNGVAGTDVTADAHWTHSIALGDMDGDGDLDLVAGNNGANRLYLNAGRGGGFNASGIDGADVTADTQDTCSVALGDVDGDGDLDLVAGNWGQTNRLYLNNGTVDPFDGVTGSDITADVHATYSVALGDVDGDGDLDLVAGNYSSQINRLYLNNGTTDPFGGAVGSDITTDAHSTMSVALADVDGDGDLDLVAGNWDQTNRLYLNNGTADPFDSAVGSDITADSHQTRSIALGDMDGDGDLDLVAGNDAHANRLYLNNGMADPFDLVMGSDITADAHITFSVALGDVDGDGDLDIVAGNHDQINRLYLNNGTADPFGGAAGSDVTTDAQSTQSVAFGDVDGDGDLDLVEGNWNQTNRLYLTGRFFDTSLGTAVSLRVDAESANIPNARLTPTASVPVHTGIDWYLSNDGGAKWHSVTPGDYFHFPTAGTDLRWRAELDSDSPAVTPEITQVYIEMDAVPPDAPVITGITDDTAAAGDGITSDNTLLIAGTAEPDSTIEVFEGGNPVGTTFADSGGNWVFDYTGTALADGGYSFTATATDEADNTSAASDPFAVVVDTAPPAFSVISATPDPAKATDMLKITFTASEALSADPTVTVDGFPAVFVSVSGLDYRFDYVVVGDETEGTVTISVSGTDLAGNAGSDTGSVTLDFTAPTFAAISATPDPAKATDTLTITFTPSEALSANPVVTVDGNAASFVSVSEYEYVVDGGETEGPVVITVFGTDPAGNAGFGVDIAWLDFTAPSAPDVSGTTPTSDTTPTWTWTGGGGGSGTFRHQLDAEAPEGWTETALTEFTQGTALPDGTYTLYVQERDDAGNWSTSGSFAIEIDTYVPPADDGGCSPSAGGGALPSLVPLVLALWAMRRRM